jgi:hypothetical protein
MQSTGHIRRREDLVQAESRMARVARRNSNSIWFLNGYLVDGTRVASGKLPILTSCYNWRANAVSS